MITITITNSLLRHTSINRQQLPYIVILITNYGHSKTYILRRIHTYRWCVTTKIKCCNAE